VSSKCLSFCILYGPYFRRDILRGKHCKCSLATHMKLRLMTCHMEATEAVGISLDTMRLNEEVNDMDVSLSMESFTGYSRLSSGHMKSLEDDGRQNAYQGGRNTGESAYHWSVNNQTHIVPADMDLNEFLAKSKLPSSSRPSPDFHRRHLHGDSVQSMRSAASSSAIKPGIAASPIVVSRSSRTASAVRIRSDVPRAAPAGFAGHENSKLLSERSAVSARVRQKSLSPHRASIRTLGLDPRNASNVARNIRAQQIRKWREEIPSSHLGARARKTALKNCGLMGR
jgi:hypothetical protein